MELISALSVEAILEFQVVRRLISVKTTSKALDNAVRFVRRELKAGNFEMTTPDKEEMPTEDRTVFVEVVGGRAGECLCINDRRVAGPKPWGGGAVVRRFEVPISELQLVMAALSTLPVNDRHHSGSDSYQADAGAPALSEKVITAAEWLPIESAPKDGRSILIGGGSYSYSGETFPEDRPFEQVAKAAYVDGEWFGGFGSEYDEKYSHSPTHWMPLPSPPGAEVTISNDAERDPVSLKPDTSSQPASEAGKLSKKGRR